MNKRQALIKKLDYLIFKYMKLKKGNICEIHQKTCPNIGPMHILTKQAHPKLRFSEFNIILAGWYCSHYWTHHDQRNPKAIYATKRIEELRGKNYVEQLYIIEKSIPKLSVVYLSCLVEAYKILIKKTLNFL